MMLFFIFSTNTIIVTCRSHWKEMSSKDAKSITGDNTFKNLQAIIVVDDNIGCVENQIAEDQNCYRPSLPYPLV